MKKFTLLSFCILSMLLISVNTSAQEMTYSNKRSGNGIIVNLSTPSYSFESVSYRGEDMQQIVIPGIFIPQDEGMPNLPVVSRYIAVPQGATVSVNLIDCKKDIVTDVNIAPALRIQAESEEPEENYVKNETVYSTNANYPSNPIIVSEPTSVRGVDAVILAISPFQYNPVTKELTVYSDINVDVTFEGGSKHIGNDKYRSPWFDPILQNVFLNYAELPKVDYEKRSREYFNSKDELTGCEYLIVIPNREDFRPYANALKEYRTKQGILTEVKTLAEMGCTSTNQMKSYFHDAYNNWDIPPVAVLLMGDHNTNMSVGIPAESISHPLGSCITDNQYADVTGDLLPEMAFSRMGAETVDQIAVLTSKLYEYELTPCMDTAYYNHPITALGWQTERWFQICSEAVGGYLRNHDYSPVRINAIYQGTPGSVWSTNQNTSMVVSYFGPTGTQYIPQTPAELGGWSGGTAAQVVTAINNGACFLQHRDHGYEQGWGEPAFSSSNISQLTNVGKLTFVFTINCLTGKFNYSSPCFGEVFERYTYNGQNAGAVGYIAPTETSYSFVNDTFVWGMYDLFDPQFLPTYGPFADNTGNWMPAFGNIAGKFFLAQSNWPSNGDSKNITYQMFTSHCDPFMRLYIHQPQELAVEHMPTVMAGIAPFIITCTEGATIALTLDDQILVTAIATGEEQEIEVPFVEPDNVLTLTITRQDYLRYEAEIVTIPAEGPYLVGRGWNINDADGDGLVDYAETFTVDYKVKNVGVDVAGNVVATVTSDDPYVIFVNNVAELGNIVPDTVLTFENAFTLKASPIIPNGHTVECTVTFTSGEDIWTAKLNFAAQAPNVTLLSNGVEGQLLPGQTLNLTATFINNGDADVHNAYGTYTTDCEYITINSVDPVFYGEIPAGGTATGAFSITVSENAPFGTVINSTVTITADYDYNCNGVFYPFLDICNVSISSYPWNEGFEEGGEFPGCWIQEAVSGEAEWVIQDGGHDHHPYHAHSGSYNALAYSEEPAVVRFVSPLIDLSNISDPKLDFWHAQSVFQTYQDKLTVYYKNATDGEWQMLASYQFSLANWKHREIELPNPTANYYIAFEAEVNGGYGVVLDDVQITGAASLLGDANGDGIVNVMDVMAVVSYIIDTTPNPFLVNNADVNEDGIINVMDVMAIVAMIMN